MRHKMRKITMSKKDQSHRKSIIRNLLTSLFIHGKIRTTKNKALILRDQANKVLYRAFRTPEDFNAIRFLNSILYHEIASKRVLVELKDKYKGKNNYLRVVKDGLRAGDSAQMAIVELL